MEEEFHKHAGIVKPHPVRRLHNTKEAIEAHNKAVAPKTMKKLEKLDAPTKLLATEVNIDEDNYIYIDLEKENVEGIRIKFRRQEGRNRKVIGLQIDK